MIDVNRARAETPGVDHVTHFNNAGAALIPLPVLDAVTGHLHLEARIGGYEAEEEAAGAVARTYDAVAALLNCRRDEVAIVENATVGWDMAFYGLPRPSPPGDRILTGEASTPATTSPSSRSPDAPARDRGRAQRQARTTLVEALRGMIDERVKLIAITHMPTNGGLVNPAAGSAGSPGPASPTCSTPARRSGRCRSTSRARLRHAVGDRPQVPARPARHRLPLRPPEDAGTAGPALPRPPRGDLGAPHRYEHTPTTRGGSRTGKATSPARSGWASRSITRWAGAGRDRERVRGLPMRSRGPPACLATPSGTRRSGAAASSPSRGYASGGADQGATG